MAQFRKEGLTTYHFYHIFSRSIAKFIIFNDQGEFDRLNQLLDVCRFVNFNHKYSHFLTLTQVNQNNILNDLKLENDSLVDIVTYCIMPTHFHLILKQAKDVGITNYMSRVLNSYSRYFNTKHLRTGPLWSGRFKSVFISSNEQLLHLSRYIHLNPTSAGLVDNPEDWPNSSYGEYIRANSRKTICNFGSIIDMNNKQYRKFTEDQKGYQNNLSVIKSLTIDNYSG